MSFDGIVTKSIVSELQSKISGGKIEKIYQPEKEQLYIQIHANSKKYNLFISSESNHASIYLTDNKPINPSDPPAFCMLLRKHLQGGRISEIRQRGTERIVDLFVETTNEMGFNTNKKLTVEIMGKHSNIILVDNESGKITDSIKRIFSDINRFRQVFPGQKYLAPPSQDKVPFTLDNLRDFMQFEGISLNASSSRNPSSSNEASLEIDTLSKLLMKTFEGFSPCLANELATYHINSGKDLYEILTSLYDSAQSGNFAALYLDSNNTPAEFHIIKLSGFQDTHSEMIFESPSEAVSYYFEHRESSNTLKQKSYDLLQVTNSHLNKIRLKKQRLSEDLQSAMNMDKYKLYGELLTTYMHMVKDGADSARLLNYYDNSYVDIPLDPLLSPSINAQRYFKKYAKSKTAKIEKTKQLNEAGSEIEYLESVLEYIKTADNINQIEAIRFELIDSGYLKKRIKQAKKINKKQDPYRYVTSDGFSVMAGHNNNENDFLTFKIAKNKDIWFHTKDIPGSHVVLFPEGKPVTETALFEAAALAAWHSKGRFSENVPVDYTYIKNVKKPAGAKPGMVIFTDNKTLYVKPNEAELIKKEK